MAPTQENWQRLGQLLIAQRKAKGYHRRSVFARDLGLSNDRTLFDIENAKRQNFEPTTIAMIEHAYGWKAGSVRAVLAGGEPTVTDENPRPEGEIDRPSVGGGSERDSYVGTGSGGIAGTSEVELLLRLDRARREQDEIIDELKRRSLGGSARSVEGAGGQ